MGKAREDYDEGYQDGLNAGRAIQVEAVTTAIAQIRRGDTLDAITTLEREFWPKWASVPDSEAAFRQAANDNQEADVAVSAQEVA